MEQLPDVHPLVATGDAPSEPGAMATTASPPPEPRVRRRHAAPSDRPRTPDRDVGLATVVVVAVAVAVGIAVRARLLFHQPVTSDEAVAGLIAHQIQHGHTYAFFWGQPFGGVEPYVVAGVFAVFGQSSLTLGLTPVLLSAVAALLVWRVALRLVDSTAVALLAGALAWASPFPVLFTTTIEGGYRGVTLVCGLAVVLVCLRILDGRFGYGEFVALGLVAGVGWWALPEIAYFLIPGALVLVGAMAQSPAAQGVAQWSARIGVGLVAFVVGALPWLWTNLGSGFISLDTSKFPGAVTPLNPGYAGRLRIFFKFSLPLYLDLRRLVSGGWLFGGSGTGAPERALFVAVAVVVGGATLASLVLCFVRGGRCAAIGATVLVYPFLVALQPATWFWQDGRYTVYLGALFALVLAVGSDELARRLRHRPGPRSVGARRPLASGRLVMTVVVAASLVLTVMDFHESMGVGVRAFTNDWGNPDAAASATATALEEHGIRTGYADYWVAYKLDFLSHDQLSLTVAGSDPDRWESLTGAVRGSSSPAWLFVPPSQIPLGLKEFSQTTEIQGPSGHSEAVFLAALDRLGIPYRLVDVGPIQAVIPERPVEMRFDGQITAAG